MLDLRNEDIATYEALMARCASEPVDHLDVLVHPEQRHAIYCTAHFPKLPSPSVGLYCEGESREDPA